MTVPPRVAHLALVGPTASGKSALALALARRLPDVELVSVDSMQVYRGMDIGTAKPTAAEQAEVPHHLHRPGRPAARSSRWPASRPRPGPRSPASSGAVIERCSSGAPVCTSGPWSTGSTCPGEWPAVRLGLEAEAVTPVVRRTAPAAGTSSTLWPRRGWSPRTAGASSGPSRSRSAAAGRSPPTGRGSTPTHRPRSVWSASRCPATVVDARIVRRLRGPDGGGLSRGGRRAGLPHASRLSRTARQASRLPGAAGAPGRPVHARRRGRRSHSAYTGLRPPAAGVVPARSPHQVVGRRRKPRVAVAPRPPGRLDRPMPPRQAPRPGQRLPRAARRLRHRSRRRVDRARPVRPPSRRRRRRRDPCDDSRSRHGRRRDDDSANADGSLAETSGNGIRCLAQAVVDAGLVRGPRGRRRSPTPAWQACVARVTGAPQTGTASTWVGAVRPTRRDGSTACARSHVDMGNPHLVLRRRRSRRPSTSRSSAAEQRRARRLNVEVIAMTRSRSMRLTMRVRRARRRRDTGVRHRRLRGRGRGVRPGGWSGDTRCRRAQAGRAGRRRVGRRQRHADRPGVPRRRRSEDSVVP